MSIWDVLGANQYISLHPWVWVQLESSEPLGPFPYIGGVAPDVLSSLHEVHSILLSSLETAISDVYAKRAPLDDPALPGLVEDAYTEVVQSRPRLQSHIRCGRHPDGTFFWEYPKDPTQSATVSYTGIRIFNAVTREAIPFAFELPMAARVGTLMGFLNGRRMVSEIRTIATASGYEWERHLTQIIELLHAHDCFALSPTASVEAHWARVTQDQDVIHLGHAALLYRQQNQYFWFDPWLMPWFAESPVPSLWTSLLPRPSAIFLTHDHDDHVDPRTLLHVPKDIPIIVPSRKNRGSFYYDYLSLMRELGFTQVIELAHGDTWTFEGGQVVAVPFYGEDPCDLGLARNCYLIADRGYQTLVHADSGPTNDGRSAIKDNVIEDLVARYGPISTIFASQQQLQEVRTYSAHASLSHPGKWMEVGENGFLTNQYLADLASHASARLLVSYATGGAEWYPDHLSFMFSQRNPARTALLTAHWEPPEALKDLLASQDCAYHFGHALDIVRHQSQGTPQVVNSVESLAPLSLYQLDHRIPNFLKSHVRE
ncbi:MAG: hypothetical protein GKS05_01485 [Nitrospirales bacterium]|nr:hypothetical protein [Nitrospirales bacterium]